jgi:hypothetical protein
MSVLSTIGRIASDFRTARNRYLTERAIRSLPPEVQKDIGWPEVSGTRSPRHLSVGTWAGSK